MIRRSLSNKDIFDNIVIYLKNNNINVDNNFVSALVAHLELKFGDSA
jgi:hypothetical protein